MKQQTAFMICIIFATSAMLAGCGTNNSEVKQTSGTEHSTDHTVLEKEKSDLNEVLHEAEKHHQKVNVHADKSLLDILGDPKEQFNRLCLLRAQEADQPFNISCIVVTKIDSHTYEVLLNGRSAVLTTLATEFSTTGRTTIPVVYEGTMQVKTERGFERKVPLYREALSQTGAFVLSPEDVSHQRAKAEELAQQSRRMIVAQLLASGFNSPHLEKLTSRLGGESQSSMSRDLRVISNELSESINKGYTSLHYGIAVGDYDLIECCIKAGMDTRMLTAKGQTCLQVAVKNHYRGPELDEIVNFLTAFGCSFDDGDAGGRRLAHHATMKRDRKMLDWLYKNGANLDAEDKQGQRPLHYAVIKAKDHNTIKHLLELKATLDVVDHGGRTPLHYACESGAALAVDVLLNAGANANVADEHGQTPLHLACQAGSSQKIESLIDHGAKLCLKNAQGLTPARFVTDKRLLARVLLVGKIVTPSDDAWTLMAKDGDVYAGWCEKNTDCTIARLSRAGKTRWSRMYDGNGVYKPVVLPDGTLYVTVNHGYQESTLVCIAVDGSERWTKPLTGQGYQIDSNGRVYLHSGKKLTVFSSDGEELHRAEIPYGNNLAVLGDRGMYLDAKTKTERDGQIPRNGLIAMTTTGKINWEFNMRNQDTRRLMKPILRDDGVVYVCLESGQTSLVAISKSGDQEWSTSIGGEVAQPIIRKDGTLIVPGANIYCISPNGKKLWKYDFQGDFKPILGGDGMIYVADNAGSVVKLTTKGECVGKLDLFTGRTFSGIDLCEDGTLYYFCHNGRAYMFNTLCW